jgi:hypothetical protein
MAGEPASLMKYLKFKLIFKTPARGEYFDSAQHKLQPPLILSLSKGYAKGWVKSMRMFFAFKFLDIYLT